MQTLVTIIHVVACVFLILVVLLQAGRGGGMGAAFGGAGSQIFGGRGAGDFLTRVTTITAAIFFTTSISLATMSSRQRSAVERALEAQQQTKTTPAEEAPAAGTPAAPAPANEVAPNQAPVTANEGTPTPPVDGAPAAQTPAPGATTPPAQPPATPVPAPNP